MYLRAGLDPHQGYIAEPMFTPFFAARDNNGISNTMIYYVIVGFVRLLSSVLDNKSGGCDAGTQKILMQLQATWRYVCHDK